VDAVVQKEKRGRERVRRRWPRLLVEKSEHAPLVLVSGDGDKGKKKRGEGVRAGGWPDRAGLSLAAEEKGQGGLVR
jgi:hypothetical protein